MRTAVPHQIEFHIAAAPVQLKLTFALAISHVFASLDNRQVGLQKRIPHALHHGKTLYQAEFLEIVEKDAADAALFLAMLEVKVFVAPLLEARVFVVAERRQSLFADLVEMHSVFFKAVKRSQIHAAAEPAHRLASAGKWRGRKHPDIHMHRRHIRIAGVKDQRNTHRFERRAGQFGPVLGGGRRQLQATNLRKAAAGALEHATLLHDFGDAVSLQRLARFFQPFIVGKRLAVGLGDGIRDAFLQTGQKGANGCQVDAVFCVHQDLIAR